MDKLKLTEEKIDFNMKYLKEKNLIKVQSFIGGGFIAQITAFGIDEVEQNQN